MGERVYVDVRPPCDLCAAAGEQVEAAYDGKTIMGPWAYLCTPHWRSVGVGLGTGLGQELIKVE